jgi:hypothetical protein
MARKRVAKTTTVVTTATNDGTPVSESGSIGLSRRTIEKGGLISFAREGVRASLYFNKTMFVLESPVELTLTADNLRAPSTPPPTPDASKAKAKATALAAVAVPLVMAAKAKAAKGKKASATKRKPAPEKSTKPRRTRTRKSA